MTAIPRRKALCAILVLSLLGSLWWLFRPYDGGVATVTMTPTVEPATERVQRKAAVEIARMPIDPWTLAESIAASSTPKSASPCGEDERPRYDDVGQVVARGGAGYVAALRRIDIALRASSDPLARALADGLDLEALEKSTSTEHVDSLVQRALPTADARVYALAYRMCQLQKKAPASCGLMNARQWAQLDNGNAVPWLYLLSQAKEGSDSVAQEEALNQLASATRFDEKFGAASGILTRLVSNDDSDQSAVSDVMHATVGIAAAQFPSYQALTNVCRDHGGGDESRAQLCTRIAELMFEHSDTMVDRNIGAALYFVTTGDPAMRDSARAEQAGFRDHWEQMTTRLSSCSEMRSERRYFQRMAQVGELAANRELLAIPVQP